MKIQYYSRKNINCEYKYSRLVVEKIFEKYRDKRKIITQNKKIVKS